MLCIIRIYQHECFTFLLIGLLLHVVGKMEGMEGEDFYNDDLNIDGMEEKEELPGDLNDMMEDWRNKRFNGQPVSTKHLTINGTKFESQKIV